MGVLFTSTVSSVVLKVTFNFIAYGPHAQPLSTSNFNKGQTCERLRGNSIQFHQLCHIQFREYQYISNKVNNFIFKYPAYQQTKQYNKINGNKRSPTNRFTISQNNSQHNLHETNNEHTTHIPTLHTHTHPREEKIKKKST